MAKSDISGTPQHPQQRPHPQQPMHPMQGPHPSKQESGVHQSVATRETDELTPQTQQAAPPPPESSMSGADLLMMLLKSGTGQEKLAHGMRILNENPKATSAEVYNAIAEAGRTTQIRPFPGMVQGIVSLENKYEETLRKARRIMQGATLEDLVMYAKMQDAANRGTISVSEADIKRAQLSSKELETHKKDQEEKNFER